MLPPGDEGGTLSAVILLVPWRNLGFVPGASITEFKQRNGERRPQSDPLGGGGRVVRVILPGPPRGGMGGDGVGERSGDPGGGAEGAGEVRHRAPDPGEHGPRESPEAGPWATRMRASPRAPPAQTRRLPRSPGPPGPSPHSLPTAEELSYHINNTCPARRIWKCEKSAMM